MAPLFAALVLGVALAVMLPGTAYASTTITVRSPGAAAGPVSANSESASNANCRTGGDTDDVVSGVGINQTVGTGTAQSNLHVKGIVPFDGTAEYVAPGYSAGSVDTDAAQARAIGGTGGSGGGLDAAFGSAPYAMCLDPGDTITGTQIVMNSVAGPTAAGGTIDLAVATCPEGTRLLGGGARTTPGTVGALKPVVSYPTYFDGTGAGTHDNGEIAADEGETNPDSWAAGGLYGSTTTGSANTTYAYAICSGDDIDVSGVTVTVRYNESSGPTSVGAPQKTTVGCGEGDGTLISGGAGISGGDITTSDFSAPGAQGDHLNGSYPSDGSGNPLTSSPADWTSTTHTGGTGSTSATRSHVWALCMTGN